MSATRASLKTTLALRYTQIRDRLAARLGSQDLAGEALHETWIKFSDLKDDAPVNDPDAYIYRAAINMAATLSAKQRRVLGSQDIEDILSIPDDAPGPERIALARSELAHVWKVLGELTPRQRHVFIESFTGTMSHEQLAEHYGVTVRLIQMDLRGAILHCARRTRRKNPFAERAARVSTR
ncbi:MULTISPECIES: RNA polymerase sigma factor [Sphingomonadales]|uniref:RNA polymerase sigma factor n=2 Tax=Sphingomonadales TaxID=204457 RepID=A0A1S1HFQ7_9SPHN|nr:MULTISPECIES: sigma-70 family RNA polymerase sigma factor [Sphingomonadales]MEA3390825.1 sigma-70 family RNA polymerase sigma factor [Pseudomonadota bacterium]TNE42755.1 MAG: sigma-70 family RNA polymerase sigma factor [Sphingomonadales bacterium]AGH51443.1 sigma-24 (FecI-like) protein [Sphingomonas sp. MM-1]MBB4150132.1 RNA polymerase sigma-70 factor (ECF subfamily) [Sphingobium scionense]OHT20033.1 RNA polymerase sigma factor [Sphingomonas haloaromaticamans]